MFSIIINTTGRSIYLRHTLDSLARQKYQDFELIVVLNGCDSDSRANKITEMLDRKQFSYKLFRVGGLVPLGHARSIGISLVSRDRIIFLDDDDIFEVNHLDLIASSLLKNDSDIIVSGFKVIEGDDQVVERKCCELTDRKLEEFLSGDERSVINYPFGLGAVCFRRDVFSRIDFNRRKTFIVDFELMFEAIRYFRFSVANTCTFQYRINLVGLSSQKKNLYREELLDFVERKFPFEWSYMRLVLFGFVFSRHFDVGQLLLNPRVAISIGCFSFFRIIERVVKFK